MPGLIATCLCLYNSVRMMIEEINLLLKPFIGQDSLSPEQGQQVQTYLDLLLKWNARINLTSVRSAEEIVTRHFGECFFAARHLAKTAQPFTSTVDIGSGAGFPGLPLKISKPEIKLTLVESNNKKVAFLREAVRALGLTKTEVRATRAEELNFRYEVVMFRAVERFKTILPIAASLLQTHGVIGLLIGNDQVRIAKQLIPDISWNDPIPIPASEMRVLLIGRS